MQNAVNVVLGITLLVAAACSRASEQKGIDAKKPEAASAPAQTPVEGPVLEQTIKPAEPAKPLGKDDDEDVEAKKVTLADLPPELLAGLSKKQREDLLKLPQSTLAKLAKLTKAQAEKMNDQLLAETDEASDPEKPAITVAEATNILGTILNSSLIANLPKPQADGGLDGDCADCEEWEE